MNAEASPPSASKPPQRSRIARNNRWQVTIFAVLTLLLTVATVWGGRVWLTNSETLVFAVGDANSAESRFATKLAGVLKSSNSKLRLRVVRDADNGKALAQFDRKQADLAILRTDAKVPERARALAILEHDVLLLLSPGNKKIKTLADLKKKKIAVLANSDSGAVFVRSLLDISEGSDAAARVQMAPPNSTIDKLLASNTYGAVVAIAHASAIIKDHTYEQYAKSGGFTLNAIGESKSLARKNPAISEETLATGMLSSSPAIPDDDLDTVGLEWILVAQSKMSTGTAGELARTIYENKAALALDDGFASKIEPADTDKDAFIVAHQGAAEYINDDTKSFMDRYSDLMYLGAGALSVIGSIFAGLYTKVTRVAPEKAGELATAILDIGEQIEHANSMEALDRLQDELETILRTAVIGLRDGTISSDGLDTFKLGYEFVRDELSMRRESLKRHPNQEVNNPEVNIAAGHDGGVVTGHEDNVVTVYDGTGVIIKTAQSA